MVETLPLLFSPHNPMSGLIIRVKYAVFPFPEQGYFPFSFELFVVPVKLTFIVDDCRVITRNRNEVVILVAEGRKGVVFCEFYFVSVLSSFYYDWIFNSARRSDRDPPVRYF